MNRTSTETLLHFGAHIITPLKDLHLPLKFSLRSKRVGFLDSFRFNSHDFPTKYYLHSKRKSGDQTHYSQEAHNMWGAHTRLMINLHTEINLVCPFTYTLKQIKVVTTIYRSNQRDAPSKQLRSAAPSFILYKPANNYNQNVNPTTVVKQNEVPLGLQNMRGVYFLPRRLFYQQPRGGFLMLTFSLHMKVKVEKRLRVWSVVICVQLVVLLSLSFLMHYMLCWCKVFHQIKWAGNLPPIFPTQIWISFSRHVFEVVES